MVYEDFIVTKVPNEFCFSRPDILIRFIVGGKTGMSVSEAFEQIASSFKSKSILVFILGDIQNNDVLDQIKNLFYQLQKLDASDIKEKIQVFYSTENTDINCLIKEALEPYCKIYDYTLKGDSHGL